MSNATQTESAMDEGRAKQAQASLESDAGGVKVSYDQEQSAYLVKFPFSQAMIRGIKSGAGAKWDIEKAAWSVPVSNYDKLSTTVDRLRGLTASMAEAKESILAEAGALAAGAPVATAFTKTGFRYEGAIVAANDHYVAQNVATKDAPGAITIHERAALTKTKEVALDEIAVGRDLSVFYKDGAALMWNRQQQRQQAPERAPEATQAPAQPKQKTPKRTAAPGPQ